MSRKALDHKLELAFLHGDLPFDDSLSGNSLPEHNTQTPELSHTLPLDAILPRSFETRPLDHDHVQELVDSIALLGLIEPLVVDLHGRLLAGGHRFAALRRLREQQPEHFGALFPDQLIPVRSLPFDAADLPDLALQIEVSENEKRKNYSPAQVRDTAALLLQRGYCLERGRPKPGDRPLVPALMAIFGKSRRSIMNYLQQPQPQTSHTPPLAWATRDLRSLERLIQKAQSSLPPHDDSQQQQLLLALQHAHSLLLSILNPPPSS